VRRRLGQVRGEVGGEGHTRLGKWTGLERKERMEELERSRSVGTVDHASGLEGGAGHGAVKFNEAECEYDRWPVRTVAEEAGERMMEDGALGRVSEGRVRDLMP
jgi:hypothetical protein